MESFGTNFLQDDDATLANILQPTSDSIDRHSEFWIPTYNEYLVKAPKQQTIAYNS